MFRRFSLRNSFSAKPKEFVRTKIIKPATLLNSSEKIKQWNQESKQLFGPLLETNRQRKLRSKKSDNTKTSTVDESPEVPSKDKGDETKVKMMNNVNYCSKILNIINSNPARSFSTNAVAKAVSSQIQSGYHSEDRILQIKPHKNDYAEQYPSVTLILNRTMTDDSKSALEKWKQERIAELGHEEFNRFYQAQMAVGTKFHSTLKDYFTQPRTKLIIEKDVEGVWNSVGEVLKSISSPKAIESNVVHPVLKYRGIFDAIADYEEKPTLIEWKKSDKPRKSISLTYDNPVQLAAYFGAVCNDLNYKDFNIRDALLVIAYTDGSKADAYHFSIDKLREHWAQWLIRLERYMQKNSKDSEKILKGGKRLFEEDIGNLS